MLQYCLADGLSYKKFHIFLPISFYPWTLSIIYNFNCGQLTYVRIQRWMAKFYFYSFLVNEDIGFILVIQTFRPCTLSVFKKKLRCVPVLFRCMIYYLSLKYA